MEPEIRVIKADFQKRLRDVKRRLESGEIGFRHSPDVWEKKALNLTALNCLLIEIGFQARWN